LDVPGLLAVNKADLNEEVADQLEATAVKHGIVMAGRIPYDRAVTQAQIARRSVVEVSDGPAATAIRSVWNIVNAQLQKSSATTISGLVQLIPITS
jgi:MinD superfamily P-loop ATPase